MFGWLKQRRRRRRILRGLTAAQHAAIAENVWQFPRLASEEQQRLIDWVCVFLDERHWEGCNGFRLTPTVRAIIAASAGLVVLGHDDWYFDRTPTILVYPDAYEGRESTTLGPPPVVDWRAGEAWYRGAVVVNWRDVVRGGRGPDRGRNVVFHEFSHQLDMIDDPSADGIPPLLDPRREARWKEVTGQHFDALVHACEQGGPRLLDCYGATSPSEFFAVASETFFQRGEYIQRAAPDLYEVLSDFYRMDPAVWTTQPAGTPVRRSPT